MNSRALRHRHSALAALVSGAVVLAGCGTTVPLTSRQTLASGVSQVGAAGGAQAGGADGLGSPVTSGSGDTSGGTSGVSSGGATTGVGGDATGAGQPVAVPGAAGTGVTTTNPVSGTAATPRAVSTAKTTTVTGRQAAPKATGAAKATPKASNKTSATTAAVTAPLQIGVIYPSPSAQQAANSALGASTSANLNAETTIQAFIRQINATGGLSGRMLKPVALAPTSTTASEEQSDCSTFTQDNHVPVVIDALWGGAGDFASCLQAAGVVDIDITQETDAASLAKLTLHFNLLRLSMDRAYGAVVTDLAQSGYVTKQNKIGVLMDTCANSTAAYMNTVLPDFQKLGLVRVATSTVDCNGSTADASSQIASAVLTFRSDLVDRVMIISTSEQTGLLLFGAAAGAQGYTPGYMLSSQAEASAVAPLLPAAQAANLHGVGNLPVFDVTSPTNPGGPAEASCVSDMAKQQITPSTSDDFYYVYLGCTGFRLLGAALAADGGNSTPATLAAAIAGLGSFASPGVVGDSASVSSNQHDAPAQVRVFGYQASCSCMAYTSSAQAA